MCVLNGTHSSEDVVIVIEAIHGRKLDNNKEADDDIISDCKSLLLAMDGDIVSMMKIVENLNDSDSHVRSLLTSLISGQTKFDTMSTKEEEIKRAQRDKNMLVREMYRIFEKSVREEYPHRPIGSGKFIE